MQIFKYALYGAKTNVFCGEILHFGEQNGDFFVWAKTEPTVNRTVQLITTGQVFDDTGLRHIGSVVAEQGTFVVHAFVDNPV